MMNIKLPSPGYDFSAESILLDYDKPLYTWEQLFYLQNQIDLKCRYENFYIQRDKTRESNLFNKLNPNKEPYAIIHSTGSDGKNRLNPEAVDSNLKQIYIEQQQTDIIFDYITLLQEAEEIHCIDSRFKHLTDHYQTNSEKTNKLFYHNKGQRRKARPHTSCKKWNLV